MAENLSCKNHPNVSAIEECANCAIPMCGMCSNFTETDVLCEKCVEIRETEKYVAAQSQQLDQPEKPLIVVREEDAALKVRVSQRRRNHTDHNCSGQSSLLAWGF